MLFVHSGINTDYKEKTGHCQALRPPGGDAGGRYFSFISQLCEKYEKVNIPPIPLLASDSGVKWIYYCGKLSILVETQKDVLNLQKREPVRRRARRRRMSYNARTRLWLILCYPLGLTHMWRSRCSWKLGTKYAISSIALVVLAAVILAPAPKNVHRGSIELYGEDPEVEVYGPVLPENYVTRSTGGTAQSVIVRNEDIVDDTFYVYASRNGKGYHLKSCEYYYDGSQKLTVYEAYYMGYKACSSCNPPIYTGGVSQ